MAMKAVQLFVFVVIIGSITALQPESSLIDAENVATTSANDMEQCQAICVDIFFLLPDDPMAMSACQRGCRMFNIIYLRDDRSLNTSKDECYSSCGDAYPKVDLNTACRKGCKNMLIKKQTELEAVIVYIGEEDNDNNPQVEPDALEINWFIGSIGDTPPELHYVDGKSDYKIPESLYRTLPVEELIEELAKPGKHVVKERCYDAIYAEHIISFVFILILLAIFVKGYTYLLESDFAEKEEEIEREIESRLVKVFIDDGTNNPMFNNYEEKHPLPPSAPITDGEVNSISLPKKADNVNSLLHTVD